MTKCYALAPYICGALSVAFICAPYGDKKFKVTPIFLENLCTSNLDYIPVSRWVWNNGGYYNILSLSWKFYLLSSYVKRGFIYCINSGRSLERNVKYAF